MHRNINNTSEEYIKCVKESIEWRKSVIDFDTLGKTLAYSPYMPRVGRDFFIRVDKPKTAKKFTIESFNDSSHFLQEVLHLEEKHGDFHAYMLDLCTYCENTESKEALFFLESISLLRRYSTLPIIHVDIFIDKYQILESALFGADAIFIFPKLLEGKALLELINFARKLELNVFVSVDDKDELKKAIFAGADMLFIPKEHFETILSLVPNTKVIATNYIGEYGVDMWIK